MYRSKVEHTEFNYAKGKIRMLLQHLPRSTRRSVQRNLKIYQTYTRYAAARFSRRMFKCFQYDRQRIENFCLVTYLYSDQHRRKCRIDFGITKTKQTLVMRRDLSFARKEKSMHKLYIGVPGTSQSGFTVQLAYRGRLESRFH